MTSNPTNLARLLDAAEANNVASLASHAVSMVAARSKERPHPENGWLARLDHAAVRPNGVALCDVIRDMGQSGIPVTTITDDYLPAVARRFGESWVGDRMGFADVTIGMSRLQSALRDIALDDGEVDPASDMATGRALVAVPQGESHTFGAVLLAQQMRRAGLNVRLKLGAQPAELEEEVAAADYDFVALSGGHDDVVEPLRAAISAIRGAASSALPVVVGGSLTDRQNDVARRTGADLATCDLGAVLEFSGVSIKRS